MKTLQKRKTIFIKRFTDNFEQFLVQEIVITQHIKKLDTEDLWILRYCRSRFFTFIFFMQKLSGTSLGKNNKSCSIFTMNPTKLSLHFSEFATIFYAIYKNHQNIDSLLHQGPWNFSAIHRYALTLHETPWK
jgi:hypothetical protein